MMPLSQLLQIDTLWSFDKSRVEAINLKEIITTETILQFHYLNQSTKIMTDAIKHGHGAVMEQGYNRKWLPISFDSYTETLQNRAPVISKVQL